MRWKWPRVLLLVVVVLAAACGLAAPAPETTMAKEEDAAGAMMDEGEAMMDGDKPEGEAMMDEEKSEDEAVMDEDEATMAEDAAMTDESKPEDQAMMTEIPPMITAPHFVDSFPAQAQGLAAAPPEIVINFNFNLHPDSLIQVSRDGQPVEVGDTTIDESRLTLRAPPAAAGDGVYSVDYRACWPDGSCHEGAFSFVVKAAAAESYLDLRGRSEMTIRMKDITFGPAQVIVSPGTTVTWINDDPVEHFVNSDPHPSHNVYPALNSTALGQGASYSFTFDEEGIWYYHCSAHYPHMVASLRVDGS